MYQIIQPFNRYRMEAIAKIESQMYRQIDV